jgi:hypothetical protein
VRSPIRNFPASSASARLGSYQGPCVLPGEVNGVDGQFRRNRRAFARLKTEI